MSTRITSRQFLSPESRLLGLVTLQRGFSSLSHQLDSKKHPVKLRGPDFHLEMRDAEGLGGGPQLRSTLMWPGE